MNQENFKKLLERRHALSAEVLNKKNIEYGTDIDMLESFKEQAEISIHNTPMAIGWELLVKHLYSVRRIIREYEEHGKIPDQAMIDEKFGDAVNYLILIEALFKELED
jgi:hypothetical protein